MSRHLTRSLRHDATRRGVSLAEIVATLGAASSVMGLAVGLIGTLFRLERHAREGIQQAATLARLTEQFRDDARAASSARPTGGPASASSAILLDLPDGKTVEYRAVDRAAQRLVLQDDQVAHRDAFLLSDGAAILWRRDGGEPAIVGFSIIQSPVNGQPVRTIVRVDAALGGDSRYRASPR